MILQVLKDKLGEQLCIEMINLREQCCKKKKSTNVATLLGPISPIPQTSRFKIFSSHLFSAFPKDKRSFESWINFAWASPLARRLRRTNQLVHQHHTYPDDRLTEKQKHKYTCYCYYLVGGFNLSEKIIVSWGYYSQYIWKNKKCSKPPTGY